jgi:pimeloyl-ACP methyl ester carboxylesterase
MFRHDSGRGQPLLLIHGMWGDHLDWAPVMPALCGGFRVIAVDLPGFGRSQHEPVEYAAAFFTRELVALLDELQIGKAAVAGSSFGGQIAMSLALAYPERVDKLVLVNTGGLHEFSKAEKETALRERSEEILRNLTPELNRLLFSRLFFAQGSENQRRYIEKQNAKLTRPDYPHYVHVMYECMRLAVDLCLLDRVRSLRMPVLLIQGENDLVVMVDWIRAAARLFPDARLVVFPECGHVPQLEQPAAFVREVAAFLWRPHECN